MNKPKKLKQTIIPEKVIRMANAIQDTERNNQHVVIVHKRQWGETAARKLAKGEQILPTNLNDHN